MGGCGAKLLLGCTVDKEETMENGKFIPNVWRKIYFNVRIVKQRNRLPIACGISIFSSKLSWARLSNLS